MTSPIPIAQDTSDSAARTLAYNNFTFPNIRNLEVVQLPQYDQADITRSYSLYKITCTFLVNDDTEADTATKAAEIRALLSRPGGALKVTGIGFGDIDISGMKKSQADVKWGPKPRLIRWGGTLGGGLGWWGVWECEVALIDCNSQGRATYKAVSSFNNTVVYSVDYRGLCTRTISGSYEIPLTRGSGANDTSVAYSTDDFWPSVVAGIDVPFYMTREQCDRRLSADRTRMEFQIVDKEIESDDPLPLSIVRGELTKTVENDQPMNFIQFRYTLNATFERKPGTSRDWAYNRFWLILLDEVQRLDTNNDVVMAPGNVRTSILPLKIRVTNNAYRRITEMSVTFQVICNTQAIMAITGMWQPIGGNDRSNYQLYATSMADVWSGTGVNQYAHDASKDVVMDICTSGKPGIATNVNRPLEIPLGPEDVFTCDYIDEDNSWLFYRAKLNPIVDDNIQTHYPAQKFNPPDDPGKSFGEDGVDMGPSVGDVLPAISQRQGAQKVRIRFVGCCRRARFKPIVPVLKDFRGLRIIRESADIDGPYVDGTIGDCYVWSLCWDVVYRVIDPIDPDTLVPGAPNPFVSDDENNK